MSSPSPEHLDRLTELFYRSRMSRTFGMKLHFDADARAVFDMPYDPRFDHFLDDVHGGVIATLCDNAGWFTAAAQYDSWIVTVEFHVRLLEPAGREDLRATGRLVRRGRQMATVDMEVRNQSGRLVAAGSGTFAPTGKPHPE